VAQTWSAANLMPNAGAAVVPAHGTRPEFTPPSVITRSISTQSARGTRAMAPGDRRAGGSPGATLAELRDITSRSTSSSRCLYLESCSRDLIGTTRWTGVSLQALSRFCGAAPERHTPQTSGRSTAFTKRSHSTSWRAGRV
jgi:hypothetical protein